MLKRDDNKFLGLGRRANPPAVFRFFIPVNPADQLHTPGLHAEIILIFIVGVTEQVFVFNFQT